MISAWWLLLLMPMGCVLGFLCCCLIVVSTKGDERLRDKP